MSPIFDSTSHGHHVRVFQVDDDDPSFSVVMDGRVFSGFTSRVDALSAARSLVRSS